MSITVFLTFFCYCLLYLSFFLFTKFYLQLSRKQINNTLSCISSFTLSILGIFINLEYIGIYKCNIEVDILTTNAVLWFMSYLIMDLILGSMFYREHMDILLGYIHHTIYFTLCFSYLYTKTHEKAALFLLEEIPTFLLNLGKTNATLRKDTLFGFTFFFTRIIYHIAMGIHHAFEPIIVSSALIALPLHLFWFKNWCKKYM